MAFTLSQMSQSGAVVLELVGIAQGSSAPTTPQRVDQTSGVGATLFIHWAMAGARPAS